MLPRTLPPAVVLSAVLFVAFALGLARLPAQQQESGLLTRMLQPDTSLTFTPTTRSGSAFPAFQTRPFRSANFNADKDAFLTDSFRTAPATGFLPYATRPARVRDADLSSRNDLSDIKSKKVADKSFATRSAPDANKSQSDQSKVNSDASKIGKMTPKAQKWVDDFYQSNPLTIDQVRELLNKNK